MSADPVRSSDLRQHRASPESTRSVWRLPARPPSPFVWPLLFGVAVLTALLPSLWVAPHHADARSFVAKSWSGAGDGASWSDPNNWSPAVVPSSADDVTIGVPATIAAVGSLSAASVTISSASATLNIEGANCCNTQLTVTGAVTNTGTIHLTSVGTNGCENAAFQVGGTFTNNGTFTTEPGTVCGSRTVIGNLVNNGTVTLNTDTTFSTSSGSYTNNNSLTIASGKTLTISGASQTFTQASGTLTISGVFSFSNATFNYNGGTISGIPLLVQDPLCQPRVRH